jgi:hypothetical protein
MLENVRHEMVINGLLIRLLEVIDESKGDSWFVVETSRDGKIRDVKRFPNVETALDRVAMFMEV